MLTRVTITGADDSTQFEDLSALSKEVPFVEWGILVSTNRGGGYRFPSDRWMTEFAQWARLEKWNVAMHVCGLWVSEILQVQIGLVQEDA
jgi:hypothetical protein